MVAGSKVAFITYGWGVSYIIFLLHSFVDIYTSFIVNHYNERKIFSLS